MAVLQEFPPAKTSLLALTDDDHVNAETDVIDNRNLDQQKQAWRTELDAMGEFLVLKSTEEQRDDGVPQPVDTAFIEDKEGKPILKAVFDVHLFKPDDVHIHLEGNMLIIEARATEDRDSALFHKTMIRRLELPEHVDTERMTHYWSDAGLLQIELPILVHLQRQCREQSVIPATECSRGESIMRMAFAIGRGVPHEGLTVEVKGKTLVISANCYVSMSDDGQQQKGRVLRKEFNLPEHSSVVFIHHTLSEDGILNIEIKLKCLTG